MEVVVALDECRRRLEPRERLDLPLALRRQPAPDAGARGEPVAGVRLEDDEGVGHRLRLFESVASAPAKELGCPPCRSGRVTMLLRGFLFLRIHQGTRPVQPIT